VATRAAETRDATADAAGEAGDFVDGFPSVIRRLGVPGGGG
jgi:hypothetical protein